MGYDKTFIHDGFLAKASQDVCQSSGRSLPFTVCTERNYMKQGDRIAELKPPRFLGKNFYVCEDIRFSLLNKLDNLKRTNLDGFPNDQS